MTLNKGRAIAAEQRRALVASILARNPRATQREIEWTLAGGDEQSKPLIVNPTTGKPYSIAMINADVKALRAEYQEKAARDGVTWVSYLLQGYEEIYRQSMNRGDLGQARQTLDSMAKLTGANAPMKLEHGGEVTNIIQVVGADPDDL